MKRDEPASGAVRGAAGGRGSDGATGRAVLISGA